VKLDIIILYCYKQERRSKGLKSDFSSAAYANLFFSVFCFCFFIIMIFFYLTENYFIINIAKKDLPGFVYAPIPAALFFFMSFLLKKIRKVSYYEKKEIIKKYQNKSIKIARRFMFLSILFLILSVLLGIFQQL
jgi:ABC-type transport system involved in cytochrome c biogenesis permease subunit